MIQFACPNPNCRRRYNAEEKHTDQRFKCPGCRTVLLRVAQAATPNDSPSPTPSPPPKIHSLRDAALGPSTHAPKTPAPPASPANADANRSPAQTVPPDAITQGTPTVRPQAPVAAHDNAASALNAGLSPNSDELLRRQSLRVVAGQIRRVMLIEESIERAVLELQQRDQASDNMNGAERST